MRMLTLGVLVLALAAAAGAEDRKPEEVVRKYLEALQEQDFATTYELVSEGMKTDRNTGEVKSKEAWIKESQYIFQFSEAKIFDYEIFPGEVEDEKAFVPNILSSQDKFLNQLGAEEYELYTLVKEDGKWKIDQQEIVVDSGSLEKWFPDKGAGETAAQKEAAKSP